MAIFYEIYSVSAREVLAFADTSEVSLSARSTGKCILRGGPQLQEDSALFFQIMSTLHGDTYCPPESPAQISDLKDILFFVDFGEIFVRDASQKRYADRQKKAELLFMPQGITLDFGNGPMQYVAFERSGNMSRQARLSFIRADLYEPVRRRIMLDLKIGVCQLSKLYAYNGLMLSGGTRIDAIDLALPHRVIVVPNNTFTTSARVITVEDRGGTDSMRKYERVETVQNITVQEFDGEGLISPTLAKKINHVLEGKHTSFQIRLPFVKGMLHQVDFRDFLKSAGTDTIRDIWGEAHPVDSVDIILTKSMFKGYGWLTENGKTWEDYWKAYQKYRHALYITNVSKEQPEKLTELNYQFLNTVSMKAEEFRPLDLPDGWSTSPEEDSRNWITKQTETEYFKLCNDPAYRKEYFLRTQYRKGSRRYHMSRILKKNSAFMGETIFTRELDGQIDRLIQNYALGILKVSGDNRYFSGDLLRFLVLLMNPDFSHMSKRQHTFYSIAVSAGFQKGAFYAPKAAYGTPEYCTLLRNPHISRNEEIQLAPYGKPEQLREHYLGHLSDVVMVDSSIFAAERLGGADYDGDMVKTISDPVLNACVQRNYAGSMDRDNTGNIPFLCIPTIEPILRDANNWRDRFQTVKDTFSSRVGQISNAALDLSLIAYDENSTSQERQLCREQTETLAILTGLEIDSAKSGVKPDLSPYLGKSRRQRNLFLKYKDLMRTSDRKWYAPSIKQRKQDFIQNTDWSKVSANLERLPYLAYMLEQNTPRIKLKPAPMEVLFSFAENPGWEQELDPSAMAAAEEIIREYEACLNRIRISKAPISNRRRSSDIERILFSRGQETKYTAEELYSAFSQIDPEQISRILDAVREERWHLMDRQDRFSFLLEHLPPELCQTYGELLSDFRQGGYRILGDLLCDVYSENQSEARKELERPGDSPLMHHLLKAYQEKLPAESYREAVSKGCRTYIDQILKPGIALKCAAALNKRNFIWDVLLDQVVKYAGKETGK